MIRPARPKDITPIMNALAQAKVMGNSSPAFYFRWVMEEGIALVAEEGPNQEQNEEELQKAGNRKAELNVAGFLIAEKNDQIAYAQLIYLFVHPQYRKKGVGSALMERFLEICRQQGVKYIDLHAQKNTARFYQKFGFQPEGKFITMYKKI